MPSSKGVPSSKNVTPVTTHGLHTPNRSRERILVFGIMSMGKTKAYLDIARAIDQPMWIVDTDNALDRMLENSDLTIGMEWRDGKEDNEFVQENGQLFVHHVDSTDWEGQLSAVQECFRSAERQHWIALDTMPHLWTSVQEWYLEKAYGKTSDEWWLEVKKDQEARKDGKVHTANEGLFHDWGFINPQYGKIRKLVTNAHCHLIYTSNQKKVSEQQTDKNVKELYTSVMPEGQKLIGHDVHTVLNFGKVSTARYEKYTMTTVKDREREKVKDMEWSDFAVDYLEGIAGWTR